MKQILLSILLFSSDYARGQAPIFKPYQPPTLPQKSLYTDSTIRVAYIDDFKDSHGGKGTALFLNGKHVDSSVWSTLPFSFIDSMYVIHETGLSYKNLFRPDLDIWHHPRDKKIAILVLTQVKSTTKVTKSDTFFMNFCHIRYNYSGTYFL